MLEINETNFEREILNSEKPVVVDFWAPWCMPCLILAPTFEKVSQQYNGKAKFAKVNTDDNPNLAMRYSVFSIPTIIIFHKGEAVDTIVGAVPENILRSRIDQALSEL